MATHRGRVIDHEQQVEPRNDADRDVLGLDVRSPLGERRDRSANAGRERERREHAREPSRLSPTVHSTTHCIVRNALSESALANVFAKTSSGPPSGQAAESDLNRQHRPPVGSGVVH